MSVGTHFHSVAISRHYNVVGLVFIALFFAAAYTPSLLPRTWYYQGIVSGVTANAGYCVGVALSACVGVLIRRARRVLPHSRRSLPPRVRTLIDIVGLLALGLFAIGVVLESLEWQSELASMQEMHHVSATRFVIASGVLGLVVCFGLIWMWRGLAHWSDSMADLLHGWGVRPVVASTLANAFVVVIMAASVGIIIPNTGLTIIERQAVERNETYREDIAPPSVSTRSAGPGSPVAWEGLGYEGSRFIADGYTKAQLEAVTGRPSAEPIRLYAGVGNGATMKERVDTIIGELDRTGAAEREALLVMPVTGTGWANPVAAQAFELLFDGNTAIASAQFGVLPSAVSFLTDSDAAADAGRELIYRVAEWWAGLPENHRPKLYLYGESLGTKGVEASLESLRAINVAPDGVFLVGPPRSNELHRWFTQNRPGSSPEYQPESPATAALRFAATGVAAASMTHDPQWGAHRLLYLQHASDPVVWWEPSLLWKRPDWLVEPAGPGRSPRMSWYPVITFWQVSADLGGAADVPDGYGHNYASELLDGWIAVSGDPRGDDVHSALHTQLDEILRHQGPEKGHIKQLKSSS